MVVLWEHRGHVARVKVGVAVEGHEPGVELGGAVFKECRGVDDDLVPAAAEQEARGSQTPTDSPRWRARRWGVWIL
jgi:hypothetical protein